LRCVTGCHATLRISGCDDTKVAIDALYVALGVLHVAQGVRQGRGGEAGNTGVLPASADDGAANAGSFSGVPGGRVTVCDARKMGCGRDLRSSSRVSARVLLPPH
jgi:hypothetical protein